MRNTSYTWSYMSLLMLGGLNVGATSFANESPETAIELLTAFSGNDAKRYEGAFRYSEGARITRIEIHAVGNENTTARYSGREAPWYEVNNILRLMTADGHEGVSGVDSYDQAGFSDAHLRELRDIAEDLIDLKSLDPVEVASLLEQSRPEMSNSVRSSIDIALWDLAARRINLPLHELLGTKRVSIEAYASLPFYASLPEYVDAVNEYAQLGFRAFKFHVWGTIEEDLLLVDVLQDAFEGSSYRFMMDIESVYSTGEALRLGERMDQGLFVLYEAPIDDGLLTEYAMLKARLEVAIIPGGYTYYSPEFLRRAIDADSWDAGRFDVTNVGGISTALKLMMIADNAALPIEIQSWGHSLSQAANLHLMLANERTQYFEAPMPKDAFEFGMLNGNLLHDGRAMAPSGAGLGIEVDWERLPEADFYVRSILDESPR